MFADFYLNSVFFYFTLSIPSPSFLIRFANKRSIVSHLFATVFTDLQFCIPKLCVSYLLFYIRHIIYGVFLFVLLIKFLCCILLLTPYCAHLKVKVKCTRRFYKLFKMEG